MKLIFYFCAFFYSFNLAAAENKSMANSGAVPKVIKVRADTWCPFNCDPGTEKEGIIIEIAKSALAKKGFTLEYQTMNWARAIEETRSGNFDAIAGASSGDAPDFIFPSEAQAGTNYEIYTLKDSKWTFKNEDSLKTAKLGVINGYTYDDKFMELVNKKHPSIVVVSGEVGLDQLVKMMDEKRIDALIEAPGVFKNFLALKGLDFANYRFAGQAEKKYQKLFIAFGPKLKENKELAKAVSDEVKALRKNGKLKTLLNKYQLKDWK
jgi:polar amino acid transport system substrate-binding protein